MARFPFSILDLLNKVFRQIGKTCERKRSMILCSAYIMAIVVMYKFEMSKQNDIDEFLREYTERCEIETDMKQILPQKDRPLCPCIPTDIRKKTSFLTCT